VDVARLDRVDDPIDVDVDGDRCRCRRRKDSAKDRHRERASRRATRRIGSVQPSVVGWRHEATLARRPTMIDVFVRGPICRRWLAHAKKAQWDFSGAETTRSAESVSTFARARLLVVGEGSTRMTCSIVPFARPMRSRARGSVRPGLQRFLENLDAAGARHSAGSSRTSYQSASR